MICTWAAQLHPMAIIWEFTTFTAVYWTVMVVRELRAWTPEEASRWAKRQALRHMQEER